MNNVSNVKALDYSVNLISEYVTNNPFIFSEGLMNDVIYNPDFVIVIIVRFFVT